MTNQSSNVKLAALRKVEGTSAFDLAHPPGENEKVVIVMGLHKGYEAPDYVQIRAKIAEDIFTAEIKASLLNQLEVDPAVRSIGLSKAMPVIG